MTNKRRERSREGQEAVVASVAGRAALGVNMERFNFRKATYMGYMPIDCPSCGRARLQLFVREMRQRKFNEKVEPIEPPTFALQCEKCRAIQWDCDPDEHSKGSPHHEKATGYQLEQDDERELEEEVGDNDPLGGSR